MNERLLVNSIWRRAIMDHPDVLLPWIAPGTPLPPCGLPIVFSDYVPAYATVDTLPNDRFVEYEKTDVPWLRSLGMSSRAEDKLKPVVWVMDVPEIWEAKP